MTFPVPLLAQTPLPEPAGLYEYITEAGIIGLLVWIVVGVAREWWFTRSSYLRLEKSLTTAIEKAEKDRDEWKAIALRSLNTTDRIVTLAEPP